MLALPPLIYVFTLVGPVPGIVVLALVGAVTVGTFGVTVVMGQEYLPGRIGLAAGITMGFSIGLGGVGAPLLGLFADNAGLSATMIAIAGMPVSRSGARVDLASQGSRRREGHRPSRGVV